MCTPTPAPFPPSRTEPVQQVLVLLRIFFERMKIGNVVDEQSVFDSIPSTESLTPGSFWTSRFPSVVAIGFQLAL